MERSDGGTSERLAFRMPDPEQRLRGVRLQQDVRLPGARLVETRDVHTYTGWRDTLDPNLVDLVRRVLGGPDRAD